ncbi:lysylphosphatidylglycerol synthase transmembrane domain-containing protein [Spirosoma endophyticum]|uniref:Lysylphosphatidylglycerol synthase TM region n=1 Tax=Spirosoma endophyticum TaxID=662367 RepID=A0A1I1X1K7_9BACT|nr:lysylphosphatidylglycerol synthase transmembrane domain-containing protein [Spirosoma endophyticum]SFE01237.1 hypothetical protein SAMN05216167_109144 [Spirosoma endophyticum]
MNKAFLQRMIPLLLAAILLWYVLKDVPLPEIASQFCRANYGWLSLVGLLTGLFYVVRAARWKITLQAIGYQPTLFRVTVALLAGSMASMLVPGAGELTRCGTLQRTDGVPISQGIGSVVAERIIDLFMLMLVLLLTVSLEFARMKTYLIGLTLAIPNTYAVFGVIGLVIVSGLVGWWAIRSDAVRNHSLISKVVNIFEGFSRGFMAIRQLPNPGLFVVLTLLNQFLAWLGTYILLLAVDSTQNLPPTAALTIMAVSSLGGLAVPTQGGIGTYHFLVSRALILYGFTATQGAVVATFLHAVGFGFTLVLSSISFLIVPILIANRNTKSAENVAKLSKD